MKPATVAANPCEPKQAGEAHHEKWIWVERSVWTKSMLQRLDQSQDQTKWFSLWDKVWAEENLSQACLEVILNKGSAGVDGQSTHQIAREFNTAVEELQSELKSGSYKPLPAKRVWIEKIGSKDLRPLGVPAVRDRIVQAALRHVLEPIFERDFGQYSYGFRPGKSAHQALGRVEELLKEGKVWIVDADLKSFFDTIPQQKMMNLVRQRVADGRIINLLEAYLKAGVMEKGKGWQPTQEGTPQGSVISPLMANLYLNPLDHLMEQGGYKMVRYADDFVVLCQSREEAMEALNQITQWTEQAGLKLHPDKTRLVDASQKGGFDFLGYHFERYQNGSGKKWPRKKSMNKLRETIREKTGRRRSKSMKNIIKEINPTIRGWYAYFKQCMPLTLRAVDGFIRQRLRSIIRYRNKRRGIVKGRENAEYPNCYFEKLGLFCMEQARLSMVQS
jgi:RNA-directed DNA polymerase